VVFKEKEPLKNKSLVDWQEEERLQRSFEETIRDIQQKEPPRASIQTLVKSNLTKNFRLDTKNQFLGSTCAIGNTSVTKFTKSISPTKNSLVLEISLKNYWRVDIPLLWDNFSRLL
jgi:hypothetical protein